MDGFTLFAMAFCLWCAYLMCIIGNNIIIALRDTWNRNRVMHNIVGGCIIVSIAFIVLYLTGWKIAGGSMYYMF